MCIKNKYFLFYIILFLSFCSNSYVKAFKVFGVEIDPKKYAEEMAAEIRITIDNHKRRTEYEMKQKQERLDALSAEITKMAGKPASEQTPAFLHVLDQKIAQAKALQEQINTAEKDTHDLERQGNQIITKLFEGMGDFVMGELNKKKEQENLVITTTIKAREDNKGQLERMKEWFKPRNLAALGGATTITAGALLAIYYGSKLTYNYIDALMGKPDLVRESNKHGWKQNFSSFWQQTILGKKPEEIKLEDVVLPPDMAEKLKDLADDTRSTRENHLPYRNVLFYGMPGTGKTMFAKRLAKYSGMDYAIMSGADFGQFKNGEGIIELHKLFDWAEHSDKGLLIFIDEADAFLRDRRVLDNQAKDLLNAFLSRTGASSDKFMLVFASNYEDELDPAALSRINKKIHFPLPALEERIKILNLYVDKHIRNDVRIIKKGNTLVKIKIEIPEDINASFIKEIATKIDGFSGREIDQMISELRMCAYKKANGILTREIFNQVTEEKIKEHIHDMECAKQQRKRYEAATGQKQLSMAS